MAPTTADLSSPVRIAGWRDYIQLLKPRVMSLVVFTALTGMVCAGHPLNPALGPSPSSPSPSAPAARVR